MIMSITFNADEVFEMAIEVERNAARFYRKAAVSAKDKKVKQMLLDMAAMEDGHEQTFETMRAEISDPGEWDTPFDPDNEAVLYLQAMADSRGIEGKKSVTEELTGNESVKEIFEAALNAEKDSVVFYFGLRSLVPAKAGQDKVEAVIKEELSHITLLMDNLKAIG